MHFIRLQRVLNGLIVGWIILVPDGRFMDLDQVNIFQPNIDFHAHFDDATLPILLTTFSKYI